MIAQNIIIWGVHLALKLNRVENISQRVDKAIRDIPDFPIDGVVFKDITPLMLDAQLSRDISSAFEEHARSLKPDAICAIDSRGFIFGTGIAQALDIPLVLIRKKGKLPGETFSHSYDLEYGSATLEIHKSDLKPGSKVLIHDDLLATGGTTAATAELIKQAGSEVLGFSFIVDLSFLNGKEKILSYADKVFSLVTY